MRGFRVPNFPPTGCNSIRNQAATAGRREGKLTWHQKAPRRVPWLTLTLPPQVLMAPALFPWCFPDEEAEGVFTLGGGQALPGRLQVRTALPLLDTTEGTQALFSPISSQIKPPMTFLKSLINNWVEGRELHHLLLGTYLLGNILGISV